MDTIGSRIKSRRKELGLTLTDIKNMTGISSGNISDWENGKYLPSTSALIKISEILECSPDWIASGKSEISNLESDIISDNNKTTITEISGEDQSILNFIMLYKQLSFKDQEEIKELVEFKLQKEKNKNVTSSSLSPRKGSNMMDSSIA